MVTKDQVIRQSFRFFDVQPQEYQNGVNRAMDVYAKEIATDFIQFVLSENHKGSPNDLFEIYAKKRHLLNT